MIYQYHLIDQFHQLQVMKCKINFFATYIYLLIFFSLNFRVPSVPKERPNIPQQIEPQSLRTTLLSMFDEPIVSDESIQIYEQSVAVGHLGPFEPSDADRSIYEEYVASLMVSVQS